MTSCKPVPVSEWITVRTATMITTTIGGGQSPRSTQDRASETNRSRFCATASLQAVRRGIRMIREPNSSQHTHAKSCGRRDHLKRDFGSSIVSAGRIPDPQKVGIGVGIATAATHFLVNNQFVRMTSCLRPGEPRSSNRRDGGWAGRPDLFLVLGYGKLAGDRAAPIGRNPPELPSPAASHTGSGHPPPRPLSAAGSQEARS
jgi:hypothetical protein